MIIFLFIYFSRQDDIGDIDIINPNTPIQMYYDSWVECQNGQVLDLVQSDKQYYFQVSKTKGICMNRSMMLPSNFYIVYLVFKSDYPDMKVYLDGRQFFINKSQYSVCSILFYHDKNNFTLDIMPNEDTKFQFYLIGQSPNLSKLKFGLQNLTQNAVRSSNIDQLYLKSQNLKIINDTLIDVQDFYVSYMNYTGGLQFFVQSKNKDITSILIQGEIQQILILKYNITISPINNIETLYLQTSITFINDLFRYNNYNSLPLVINQTRSILICQNQYMPEINGSYSIELISTGNGFKFDYSNNLKITIPLIYQNKNKIPYENLTKCFSGNVTLNIESLQINNETLNNYKWSMNNLTITIEIQNQPYSNITFSLIGTINFKDTQQLFYEFDIQDLYIYDRPDNSPRLSLIILVAVLPWLIGIFIIFIYLNVFNKLDSENLKTLHEERIGELE